MIASDRGRGAVFALVAILFAGAGGTPSSIGAHTMSTVEAELEASEPTARVTDEPMPSLVLEARGGAAVRLAEFQGKVLILNFDEERSGSNHCGSVDGPVAEARALVTRADDLVAQIRFVTIAAASGESSTASCANDDAGATAETLLYRENLGGSAGSALGTVLGFDANQKSGVVVIDPKGRVRARFQGSQFAPVRLMMFAAALAHGEHAASVDRHAPATDRIAVQLALGGVFALIGASVYVLLVRRRGRARGRNSE